MLRHKHQLNFVFPVTSLVFVPPPRISVTRFALPGVPLDAPVSDTGWPKNVLQFFSGQYCVTGFAGQRGVFRVRCRRMLRSGIPASSFQSRSGARQIYISFFLFYFDIKPLCFQLLVLVLSSCCLLLSVLLSLHLCHSNKREKRWPRFSLESAF